MARLVIFAILLIIVGLVHVHSHRILYQKDLKRNSKCNNNNTNAGSLNMKCKNNGFIYNPDPNDPMIVDRYVCYRGLGEYCTQGNSPLNENRCMPGLACSCDVCQNCLFNGTMVMCDVRVCPQSGSGAIDNNFNLLEMFNNKINDIY